MKAFHEQDPNIKCSGGENADLRLLHPQETEGIFLPEFSNEVESFITRKSPITKHGTITESIATMSDGTLYPVVLGRPEEELSDTAIAFTTAWLTSTQGHNRHTMLRMMGLGYPTIMIGPEGELSNQKISRTRRFKMALEVSQAKTAYDVNRILDHQLDLLEVRPDKIIGIGESRGAMTGYGLDVPQYSGNRSLAYGDFTDPCFPRAPKLKELPGVISQIVPEAVTLGRLCLDLVGPQLRHYSATLHKNPEYYAKELLKIPMLLNGQAGDIARATRTETPMHNRIFLGSKWSHPKEWHKIFDSRPAVRIEEADGHHLDIAHPNTLNNISVRLETIRDMRGHDGSFDLVDFSYVTSLYKHVRSTKSKSIDDELLAA